LELKIGRFSVIKFFKVTKEKILDKFINILPEYNLKSESTYKRIVRSCLKALLRTYDSFLAALLSTFRMQVRVLQN